MAICKTILITEPVYRSYCGAYPLSPDFKAFSLSISLSAIETKGKEERKRLDVLSDVFSIFST